MDSQSVAWNCSYEAKIAEGCILDKYVRDYNTMDTPDQKQLPNPTLIERDFEKMIVFSCYLHEENHTGAIIRREEEEAKEKAEAAKEKAKEAENGEEAKEEEKEEDKASDEVKGSDEEVPEEEKPPHIGGDVSESPYYPSIYFFNISK